MRKPFAHILLFASWAFLLLGLSACSREPQPEEADALVLLSLDTKAVDPDYKGTFRVALFDANNEFTDRTGSYCTTTQTHTDANTGTTRTWLDPCRVDTDGNPLDDTGAVVSLDELADADHDGVYGLRWAGLRTDTEVENVSLAAVSPAVPVHREPAAPEAPMFGYVTWTPDARLFISDPRSGTFTGTWVDGEYVYTSKAKIPVLRERRASVTVRIECGELTEGDIQSVTLTNHIKTARYYLMAKDPYAKGFSWADGHFTTGPAVLYDCGAGAPDHLVRADGDFREYDKIYFPAAGFSDNALEPIRPEFIIMLGGDKTKPFKVRVVLNQDLDAMTHYTLTLLISRAIVDATLTAVATWDAGGTLTVLDDDGLNAGTFPVETSWHDGGSHDAENVD
jgi:hypothetical protein